MIPQTRTPPAKTAWRDGLAPLLTLEQLASLELALRFDDPRLLQGQTVEPPPVFYPDLDHDDPVNPGNMPPVAVCLLGWCAWHDGCATTAAVEEYVQRAQVGGELDALVDWYDETPRDEMRAALLHEIKRSIALKASGRRMLARV